MSQRFTNSLEMSVGPEAGRYDRERTGTGMEPSTVGVAIARRRRRGACRRLLCVAATLFSAGPALGQNRGVYPLGMSATSSGVVPPPGFTYANQVLVYARDEARDDDGELHPVRGNNDVIMDLNTLTWVSREAFVPGLRFAVSVTLPLAKNDLTSDVNGPISGGGGFADSYYLPFILGWTGKQAAIKVAYGFLAPTGRFSAGADDNVGSGYWTHTVSSGQTVYLTPDRVVALSAFELVEFHTLQEGTGTRPGHTLDVDWSVMGTILEDRGVAFQFGLVGYEARQLTARTGPEVTASEARDRYAVNAAGVGLGFTVPEHATSMGIRIFDEFGNRSTFQGYSFQFAGSVGF